mgnify:CR=1 FL=1
MNNNLFNCNKFCTLVHKLKNELKMKNLILIAMITFLGFSAQAQTKKNKNLKYTTEVNGNCEQCKKRIEKAAFSVKGVKSADWHVDHHDMHVIYDENKCSLADIKKAIAKAGHDTEGFKAIQKANTGLYYSDLSATSSTLNARKGELKYLRANAYFLLVQTYGGVPIIKDYNANPVLSFDRNSAEEVYSFIETELVAALALLPTGSYTGRVNKRAALDLLAKVYLTRGYESFAKSTDFANAASYADQAIANFGSEKIVTGDVLLTYGNPSVLPVLLQTALDQGKTFRLIVVDSRPLLEGKHLVQHPDRSPALQHARRDHRGADLPG